MDKNHYKTIDELMAAITATVQHRVDGHLIETRSRDHRQVGNVLWELRAYIVDGYGMWEDILAHEIAGDDTIGWNATTYREYPTMPHVSCPLEFIDVPWASVCFEWRQRVYDWHQEQKDKIMIGTWYEIEEEIPAANAIGGKAYWCPLSWSDSPVTFTTTKEEALEKIQKMTDNGRHVRLVSVTRAVEVAS